MWCCFWFQLKWWPHLIHVLWKGFSLHVHQDVKACCSQGQQTTTFTPALTLVTEFAVCELCSGFSSVSTGVPVWHQSIYREPRSQIWHMGSVCTHVCDTCFSSLLCFLLFFFFLITAIEIMVLQRMYYGENLLGMLVNKIPQLSILVQLNILPKSITSVFYSKHE